jgi:glutamate synthase domain-containing protein 2
MSEYSDYIQPIRNLIDFASNSFVVFFGIIFLSVVIAIVVMGIRDKTQTKHTIRRNYPVVGRMRWVLEDMGRFLREYIIQNDLEGNPFVRHFRNYVYRGAKGVDRTEAFGSILDKNFNDYNFVHSQFPYINDDEEVTPITFGEDTANPYTTSSRFNLSGMSYGALSKQAVSALAQGMAKTGGWVNTGEGGISSYHRLGGADIVFQMGTAKYNVGDSEGRLDIDKLKTLAGDPQVKMIEIKLSQGAKPGKGGILPAAKVNKDIAKARGIPVGTASISPNRHIEAEDISGLLRLIYNTKKHSQLPTGIKLCLGAPAQLDIMLSAFKEKLDTGNKDDLNYIPSFITIDGANGGTGAAPVAFMDAIGMDLDEALPALAGKLKYYELRDRIKIIASGKLITPVHAAWAFASGADVVVTGRGFLFSLGCIQARVCNKNKCPAGITSHKRRYTKGLNIELKSERVANYHHSMIHDLQDIAHACGVKSFEQLNTQHVRMNTNIPVKQL